MGRIAAKSSAFDAMPDQWLKLEELTRMLRDKFPKPESSPNVEYQQTAGQRRLKLISLLNDLRKFVIDGLKNDPKCRIQMVRRTSWDNVSFHPDTGLALLPHPQTRMALVSGARLERVALVLLQLLRALDSGDRTTKRDHLYMDESHSSQDQLDAVVDDIAATCCVTRICLNTFTSCEGLLFGDVRYCTALGDEFYCLNRGGVPTSILCTCSDIVHMTSGADFVLVVEKDTIFRRLLAHGVPAALNCILVTGKGYPDVPTRHMVSLLWKCLRIPILALVDGDPHGFEIMCTYRFGSLAMAYDSDSLACPQMRWLGYFPSDFARVGLTSKRQRTQLKPSDSKKLQDLLKRPYVQAMPELWQELTLLGANGYKRGLEDLAGIRDDYLSTNFLPAQIRAGRFL